jgi:gluconokinase
MDYAAIEQKAFAGQDNAAVLEWCFTHGRRPSEDEIAYFNAFMTKRGWRDDASEKLKASKEKRGWAQRDDIQTTFDLQDAEEGRK